MAFIGVDLHSNRFTVARMDVKNGKLSIMKETYTFESESYRRFEESLDSEDYLLVENSTNAFWFHDLVCDRVEACYVYNTNEVKRKGNKNDKLDAEKLAKKLGYYVLMGGDKKDLPTVYVPEVKVRELRGLITTHQMYNKIKTQLKNRIHSILKQNGMCIHRNQIDLKNFGEWVDELKLSDIWKVQIHTLLAALKGNEEQQKRVKEMIYVLGSELFREEIELLLSIRGFSVFTAIVLMSDVVDIKRFTRAKRFCSYLRTAPKTNASNETVHVGSINRQSRSATCALLTQSVVHFGQIQPHISEFYARVKVGKSAGKSRIAVIRKILVCAYHMLKKKERFYWTDEKLYTKKLREYHRELGKLMKTRKERKKAA